MEDFWIEHRLDLRSYRLHRHYEVCYQLLFLLRGRICYQVGEKKYEMSRGGVILLNTLEEHSLEVLEYPYERYIIQIDPSFFRNEVRYPEIISVFVKRPAGFSHLFTLEEGAWIYLRDLIQSMEREYKAKEKYWQLCVGADLRKLFVTVFREFADTFSSFKVDSGTDIAYKVMTYIEHHYTEEITVDTISQALFLNKHYISHVFKAETGYSPIEYAISLRISHAKVLLSESDKNVSEVAMECGYTDFTHFSKQFRKRTGLSPSGFRKQLR